jgi:hypothetical protein
VPGDADESGMEQVGGGGHGEPNRDGQGRRKCGYERAPLSMGSPHSSVGIPHRLTTTLDRQAFRVSVTRFGCLPLPLCPGSTAVTMGVATHATKNKHDLLYQCPRVQESTWSSWFNTTCRKPGATWQPPNVTKETIKYQWNLKLVQRRRT